VAQVIPCVALAVNARCPLGCRVLHVANDAFRGEANFAAV